jgi:hypothetical protein
MTRNQGAASRIGVKIEHIGCSETIGAFMDLGGDLGGYLWLIIDIGFVAGLAAVMIYATYKWRQRRKDRSMQEAEKQAVERTYRD